MHRLALKNVGRPNTPQEIKRLRRSNIEFCMYLGQPVLWRHMLSDADEAAGGYDLVLYGVSTQHIDVRKCPACFDTSYGQPRNDCPVCFGVGFTSVETNPDLWISEDGQDILDHDDGSHTNVPVYGGFGPPVLTWMVEPDTSVDIFKLDRQGVLTQTQNAQGFAPWYPVMGDNDLIVNVDLSAQGFEVENEIDRYQLKMVNPQTIRGWGRRSRGQEHQVGQTFEMARVPPKHPLLNVTEHG
jgi:hypothetical protein